MLGKPRCFKHEVVGAARAIAATRDALDAAGFPHEGTGYDSIGVVLGSFSAGVHATGEYLESYLKGGPAGAPPRTRCS